MKLIVEIIVLILDAILPSFLKEKAKVVDVVPELRDKGLAKLRKEGWLALLLACVLFSGCFGSTTYYVPDGASVMTRKPINNVPVWVLVDGKREATTMTIPAGWTCHKLID